MTVKVRETIQRLRRRRRRNAPPTTRARGAPTLSGLSYFDDRSILISGAGGTVGTELCHQLLKSRPARLILVDRSEWNLTTLFQQITPQAQRAGIIVKSVLDCVSRTERMQQLMNDFDVSVVLHAAAYKHVPVVEMHPVSGIENNLFGTISMATAAQRAGVAKFLLVSTDKAIAPQGVLGASKLLAELALWDLAGAFPKTRFSAVRFGNVYGSSGSVVPILKSQIANGGPVVLTDPKATRYFMSVEEAARLVLLAVVHSKGKDLFALDMGQPRSILSLANDLMAEAGRPDLKITYSGLRPGERLHEPAPVSASMQATPHPRIMRAEPEPLAGGDIRLLLRGLTNAVATNDATAVRRLLDQWIFSAHATNKRQRI